MLVQDASATLFESTRARFRCGGTELFWFIRRKRAWICVTPNVPVLTEMTNWTAPLWAMTALLTRELNSGCDETVGFPLCVLASLRDILFCQISRTSVPPNRHAKPRRKKE
jgi:hypothetical protein